MGPSLPDDLVMRLREAGVEPRTPVDPREVWERLRARFGRRATLLDRLALEGAARGVAAGALPADVRRRLTLEVLRETFPGFAWADGAGEPSRDPIEVVPHDPDWPRRYETWRARLATSLGARARRIEHVGSTAVPGLAAKPVIDVQVSVDDPAEEAAYAPAVERVGVALRSRDEQHRYFRPPEGRPRVVQIHVCAAGGTSERDHLLFRDYLRASPSVADAYGRLKSALAVTFRDDRILYTEAKSAFILDALADAEGWARRTGWTAGGTSRASGETRG